MKLDYKILHFETIESTNQIAEEEVFRNNPKEFTVFSADFQTKGKGVGTNTWQSNRAENLLVSIVLHPDFLDPADQFLINKAASLGVCRCLEEFIPQGRFFIKWPNDIWFDSKKIAGILSRNTIMGNHFETCIVGIGLNVNQIVFSAELPNPVSMEQIAGHSFDRNQVLEKLILSLGYYYNMLKINDMKEIDKQYLDKLLNYNRKAKFIAEGRQFEGIIRGVDQFGLLLVEEEGSIKKYDLKEITLKIT